MRLLRRSAVRQMFDQKTVDAIGEGIDASGAGEILGDDLVVLAGEIRIAIGQGRFHVSPGVLHGVLRGIEGDRATKDLVEALRRLRFRTL